MNTRNMSPFVKLYTSGSIMCLFGLAGTAANAETIPKVQKQNIYLPSYSTMDFKAPAAGQKNVAPVSQESLADAILADTMQKLWDQSDEHFHKGEYSHIINIHRIIVQGDPGNLKAYENSAWLLWSTDRNDEAVAFLKQGVAANPSNFDLYDELGSHYGTRLHDPAAAIPFYEQSVQFKCPYSTLHGLAHCYEKTNQWTKAVSAWEYAANYADDPLAPRRLDRARAELAKRNGVSR